MKRVITISLGWVVFAAAAAPALGGNLCVFTKDSGVWHEMLNWDFCGGNWPNSDDTATISDGQTCVIGSDASADAIFVNDGGTLSISKATLSLYGDVDSDVSGTVCLESDSSDTASIRIINDLAINGTTGTITGGTTVGGLFYALRGETSCTTCAVLTIGSGVTVTGFVHVLEIDLVNDGMFESTTSIQGIELWPGDDDGNLSGSGDFNVSAGKLEVHKATFNGTPQDLDWNVSEGSMIIEDACSGCNDFKGDLTITGGTLDVDKNLCTENKLTFSGGTIDVAASASARFSAAECP